MDILAGERVKAPVFHIPLKRDTMVGYALLQTTILWLMHQGLAAAIEKASPKYPFELYPAILDGKKGAHYDGYAVFQNRHVIRGAVDLEASYPVGRDFQGKPCLWSPERIVLTPRVLTEQPIVFSDPVLPETLVSEDFIRLLKEIYPLKQRNNVRFSPIEDPSKSGYPY